MAWWASVSGRGLSQGDLLPDCRVPILIDSPIARADGEALQAEVKQARLIVVSQTCDLEHGKLEFVALCQIHTLDEFEAVNPAVREKGRWEKIRRGTEPGLHLIASPTAPGNNRAAYVVDFGHIVSIPTEYLRQHASSLGDRWRLDSPYLEHFSQAFARFFMRVGLPSSIPPYK